MLNPPRGLYPRGTDFGEFFLLGREGIARMRVRERAVIFIDGNNFYHGVREKLKLSSLEINYASFSSKLVKWRTWEETRYYVGEVLEKDDLTRHVNQQKFIKSLNKHGQVSHHFGRFERRPSKDGSRKQLKKWLKALSRRTDISVPEEVVVELREIVDRQKPHYEEKAVDVMIASDMISMACENKYDVAYLLSADSDFTPAIKKVREAGRKVFVASATPGYKLAEVANTFIRLKRDFFHDCWN